MPTPPAGQTSLFDRFVGAPPPREPAVIVTASTGHAKCGGPVRDMSDVLFVRGCSQRLRNAIRRYREDRDVGSDSQAARSIINAALRSGGYL